MTAELDVRRLLIDAAPAALLVALVSLLVSTQIDELDGKVIVLVVAGFVGVGLSALVLHRQPILEPVGLGAPATAPVALQPDVVAGRPKKVSVVPVVGSRTDGLEAFSLPKEGAADDENEDSFVVHQPTGTIAVSDGASSSFGSRIWSRALVDNAISDGSPLTAGFVGTIMGPAAKKWKEHHEVGELPWWAVEGLRRGGFATLLVVRIGANSKGRAWQALAVGDSCVFHLRAKEGVWQLLRAFPLESAEAFGSHPLLLSSVSPAPVEGIVRRRSAARRRHGACGN